MTFISVILASVRMFMKKGILHLVIIFLLISAILTVQPALADQGAEGETEGNLSVSDMPKSLADSVNSLSEIINSVLVPLNNFLQATIGILDFMGSMLESLEKSHGVVYSNMNLTNSSGNQSLVFESINRSEEGLNISKEMISFEVQAVNSTLEDINSDPGSMDSNFSNLQKTLQDMNSTYEKMGSFFSP